MITGFKALGLGTIMALLLLTSAVSPARAAGVENLKVEYTSTPLGINVKAPRFSWQMTAPADQRDCSQSAHQIVVTDPQGATVWDSKKVADGKSLGLMYAGSPLQATTRYNWTVTVWDQAGTTATGTSWFETGLMNPAISAWDGATWIGGGNEDLVLYAPYLSVFNLKYTLAIAQGSTKAGFIFGANDSRLMDKNKNIYQVENARNQSYIKIELDISAVDGTDAGRARLHVYRAGYTDRDNATQPVRTFEVTPQIISQDNKHKEHTIAVRSELGQISLTVDGNGSFSVDQAGRGGTGGGPGGAAGRGGRGASIGLNPMGSGGDYVSFGMLCDIGFAVGAGQKASFSKLEVSNVRAPGSTLFSEDLAKPNYEGIYRSFAANPNSGLSISQGAYGVSGGTNGVFIVADPSRNAMPMLRTRFDTAANKRIAGARLYVTSRGIYEMYLNGKRVGDDYYNPGSTQYNITQFYQTYDVTSLVNNGPNALGAMLGEGWWSGLLSFGTIWNHFGDRQSLLAKLVITYEDGSKDAITTNDSNWKYFNRGPVVYSSLYMGEAYDATCEAAVKDWSTAAYDDRNWKKAVKVDLQGTAYSGGDLNFGKLSLLGQIGDNAGIYKTLVAKSVKEVRKGVFVYDMGQNLVGVPRISIRNGKAGGKITVRVAEMLYPDLPASGKNGGMIMTENYRAALSQDVYTLRDGDQVYQPHFTSHGYQYIELTGLDAPLPLEAVQALAISSVRELTADYETSNPKVNRLWSNLVWSNVDNFLTIPTDCPQRNERMGWSGDLSVFSRTATYVSNADQFLRRHMFAMRDVQTAQGRFTDVAPVGGGFGGVLWGSAGITVPWEAYQQYGDVGLLEEHYPAMVAYMNYLATTTNADTGISSDSTLGDWLGPQNNQLSSSFLTTAYHIFDLEIMTRVAELLGKADDAVKYRSRRDDLKAKFNRTFVNADAKVVSPGGGRGGRGGAPAGGGARVSDVQTAYAVGLALNAFRDESIPAMVQNLRAAVERENADDQGVLRPKYSLMTGFIGTAWISQALSDHGLSDLAYRQIQNSQYPSWLYPIDQGATSIWERLNGYTVENGFGGNNGMNSFNHYSFGAIGQWLMAYSLGIQRDEPGFRKFMLQPQPDPTGQMTWARGYYDSPYGRIASSWKVDNGTLIYSVNVPPNTTATLYLPTRAAQSVTESAKPVADARGVTFVKYENGKAAYQLRSGTYEFIAQQ